MPLYGPSPLPRIDPSTRVPEQNDIRIYRVIPRPFLDYTIPPIDVNYNSISVIGRLHPVITEQVHGEVRQINYYITANLINPVTYDDIVITEDITYTRDNIGFALYRTTEISWYKEDDTPHEETKTLLKIYSPDESMVEGKKRRGNIRSLIERKVSEFLVATEWNGIDPVQETLQIGRDFISNNRGVIDDFVELSSPNVVDMVQNATESWLDNVIDANNTTIRDYVLAEIDIWGLLA